MGYRENEKQGSEKGSCRERAAVRPVDGLIIFEVEICTLRPLRHGKELVEYLRPRESAGETYRDSIKAPANKWVF